MRLLTLGLVAQIGGSVLAQGQVPVGAEVTVQATVTPATVYVGQAARYEIAVFIRGDVRQRLRRNPEYVPPDLRGLVGYDLRDRDSVRRVLRNGTEYEVHRFVRTLFAVTAGPLEVAPAVLTYAVPTGASFFSREETRTVRSAAVAITALEPPTVGQPAGWDGAIGALRVELGAIPNVVRQGDPFVLQVAVVGRGHIALVPRPQLELPWASVVPSDEQVLMDSASGPVAGRKVFSWLVTPQISGEARLPPIRYPFFDPDRAAYQTASTEPRVVAVAAADVGRMPPTPAVGAGAVVQDPRTALRGWGRATWPTPTDWWWYWLLFVLAPLPSVVHRWRQRRPNAGRTSAVRALRRLPATAPSADRRRLVHAALAERFGPLDIPWTDPDAAQRALRREGVTPETAARLVAVLAALDAACFAANAPPAPIGPDVVALVHAAIAEARSTPYLPASAPSRTLTLCALLALGAAQATAQPAPPMASDRVAAALAVVDSAPARAAAELLLAARAVPQRATVWYDLGGASWRAADTAMAVVGWQRALRLAPLDGHARAHLRRLGALPSGSPATVWPIPSAALGWVALALWVVGWALTRRGVAWRTVAPVLLLALGAALVAHGQSQRLQDPRVAVVARPTALRPVPSLAGDGGLLALTGEVVVVVERTPLWLRVQADGQRGGWVDARDVLALDGRPWRD